MTASIHPFTRSPVRSGPDTLGAAETGAGHGPIAGAHPFPADLEPLAASHADDLRLGSICDAVEDLIERARDERTGYAHRPMGVIADVALDGLLKIKADLDATVRALSVRGALAEAQELDRELADKSPDEQISVWRELTPAQRSAVIHVQKLAMTGGGAA